jgi:hypothetical protein
MATISTWIVLIFFGNSEMEGQSGKATGGQANQVDLLRL